ncbi:MATE family efflux transporter [Enterobacter hormaechei]|uniref:MATE family efflux transporter n=1 Tax=Enterobacter hormaechei TaxID=158836 RepID=UPI0032EDDBB1
MQKYMIEARQLLALAIPVIVAQVAQTAMGFVDTVMAGGYSATDMAAVAIGTSIWLPAILFGHGLLLALTPVIAQLNGSGRRDRVAHQVRQGFWLAGFVSVLIMIVLWNAGYIIRAMHNIDPALADKAVGYLRALLWGAPGYLFFQVARNQCEGLAKTKPGMVMGFIGLLVNIPVNYIFIYGHFGMPELGGVGCGVCMAVCTALFTVLLREQIALLYNDNPEVVTLASHLMLLAAIYQISDSIQVIGSGVLRGYKDTRSIFFITFIAYWVLGLPCGYILALTDLVVDRMGPAGFWMGFIIGLTSAAIMMMLRMRFLQRQPSTVILQRAAR